VDPPRYFGLGAAQSITASSNRIVVATAIGGILYFDAGTLQQQGHIDFNSSKAQLSSDGTVLAAKADDGDAQYAPDRTLKIFSLPSGAEARSIAYSHGTNPLLRDFTLSGSGTALGQIFSGAPGGQYVREVAPVAGGAATWSDAISPPGTVVAPDLEVPIRLSPDGTRIAVSDRDRTAFTVTNLYVNGALAAAVSGWAVGWIDDSKLLVNTYADQTPGFAYSGSKVVNAAGQVLSTPALPETVNLLPLTADSSYSPHRNMIFSATTGDTLWSSASPTLEGVGAVAAARVVFASGATVRVEPR
jgi:hypothetical protein